jgi:hypothetical protein
MYPNDKSLLSFVTKATSAPATTFTTGWAAELAAKMVADTVDTLGSASAAVEIMQAGLLLNWAGAGQITVPGFVANANNASFVKEGDPIPVRQLSEGPATLLPYKVATIAALTREMVESSNAEALISDCLSRSAGLAIDAAFFDANPMVANTRPAGIRNGIAALTPSASTDGFEAFFEDVSTLIGAVSAVGGRGPFYIVANSGRGVTMQQRIAREDAAVIPIASSAVGADMICIAASAITAAIDADPEIETANAGTLVMQDTNPAVAGTNGPERSLFQTDSLAIKVRWPASWALRDTRAVAWLTPAWK